MSLALTALRLAAVAALSSDAVIAAECPGRVYDSRIPELDHHEPLPVILVSTEELEGEAWSKNNGGAPFDDACDLVLEIAMKATADDGDLAGIWIPATDAELEAKIDLLEHRAEEMLTVGETAAGRLLRTVVTRRVTHRTSSRFVSDATGEKLAIRLLTLRVELKGESTLDATVVPSGPYALLPDPLRTVAASLQAGSAGRDICDRLLALIQPHAETPFRGIDVTFDPRTLSPGITPDPDQAAAPFDQTITVPNGNAP